MATRLNHQAIRKLLTEGAEPELERRARMIAAAAGEGHRVEVWRGRERSRASVSTDSYSARYRQAKSFNLSRAIEAGRG